MNLFDEPEKFKLDYEIERTILNDIEEENGVIILHLSDGEKITGKSDIIVFDSVDDEDDDNFDEIESIRFLPDGREPARYFRAEEILSYEVLEKTSKNTEE